MRIVVVVGYRLPSVMLVVVVGIIAIALFSSSSSSSSSSSCTTTAAFTSSVRYNILQHRTTQRHHGKSVVVSNIIIPSITRTDAAFIISPFSTSSSNIRMKRISQQQPSSVVVRMMMMISPFEIQPMVLSSLSSTTGTMIITSTAMSSNTVVTTILTATTTLINEFYLTYPYLSAFLTCSCKAGIADYIVQQHQIHKQQQPQQSSLSSSSPPLPLLPNNIMNMNRNIGFILYGGFYQGLFQQYMYGTIFPQYFEPPQAAVAVTTIATTITTILQQLLIDMLILGPLLCLPISYIVQSMCSSSTTSSSSSSYSSVGVNAPRTNHNHHHHHPNAFGGTYGWDRTGGASNPNVPKYLEKFQLSMFVTPSYNDHPPSSPNSLPIMTSSAIIWNNYNKNHHRLDDIQENDVYMYMCDHFPILAAVHDTLVQCPIIVQTRDGIDQYIQDIQDQNILLKYWLLWIPIKCITFTIIPNHLRIVFIATISFFWMMILSSSSTNTDTSSSDVESS